MNMHISLEPVAPWPDLWTGPSDWARARTRLQIRLLPIAPLS